MFRKKPVLAIYKMDLRSEEMNEDFYFNAILSGDGKYHSFRCPEKTCGRPVKIGYPMCPFCYTKLKWVYPFKTIEIN